MKHTARSFGHASAGLLHAIHTERNLRRFLLSHIVIVGLGLWLDIALILWCLIFIFGGCFVVVELLNTAIERLADTFDDCEKKHRGGHYHPGIKMTKDVAAAASLIALTIDVCVLFALFFPLILIRLNIHFLGV